MSVEFTKKEIILSIVSDYHRKNIDKGSIDADKMYDKIINREWMLGCPKNITCNEEDCYKCWTYCLNKKIDGKIIIEDIFIHI